MSRGRWQGMTTIFRFNWPFYAVAVLVLILAGFRLVFSEGRWIQGISAAAGAGVLYFLVGSLGVSHLIYDRSDLYRWNWLKRALSGKSSGRRIVCHSGFDEVSAALREMDPDCDWLVLDHYDETRMPEASIRRARKRFPPTTDTVSAPYDRWPADSDSADVVFGLLAIHELRSEIERTAWFAQAGRCLQIGGYVILAEHLRDLVNGLAFGPGFLHFHSRASWQRCWQAADLRLVDEFRVTPWIRIFVLSRSWKPG